MSIPKTLNKQILATLQLLDGGKFNQQRSANWTILSGFGSRLGNSKWNREIEKVALNILKLLWQYRIFHKF